MHLRPPLPRAWLVATALALALPAHAAPDADDDPLLPLLRERGLLPAMVVQNTQDLVQQVRDTAADLVLSAMNFLGVPYRRGGNSPEQGFDCSGFTRHIFQHTAGLVLPHRAEQQATQPGLEHVPRDQLEPGDLVFFNTMRRAFSHVGIYIGDGKFIHAPRSGAQVRVEDMTQTYWTRRYNGARRADLAAATANPPPR